MSGTAKGERKGRGRGAWWGAGAYLVVWLGCAAWFWLGRGGGGWITGYTLFVYYLALPAMSLIAGCGLGWSRELGPWRWASAAYFGVMWLAGQYATFVPATALGLVNIAGPEPGLCLMGAIPGALGLLLGAAARILWERGKRRGP